MKKSLIVCLALVMSFAAFFSGCGKGDGKIEIVVDGGGVAGNYNSSISMTPTAANPNPYNYLEQLAEEWSANNDKYTIKINRNSLNGGRDAILSYLSTSSGPDIIYQTGTTIAEDMDKNYFVDMTDYLNEPNPYVEGNEKWSDLYDPQELEASRAPNGNFYSIGIDRNVAGIMYNKDILTAAGITEPIETYGDFIEAQEKIKTYSDLNGLDIIPYSYVDNWYDIVLESALYGSQIDEIDVIRQNGIVDTEELCRASYLDLYKIMNGSNMDARYAAYLQLIYKAQEGMPAGSKGNTAVTEFMNGKIAMVSCLGKSMVQVQRQNKVNMGVMGYPILTQEDVDKYSGQSGVAIDERGVRRGISGIGTGWWITNAAMKKETVEACVDFLQFVTAPQNNVPIVNKLGYAIPLDTEAAATDTEMNELFKDLITTFNEDVENDFFEFHVFNSWGIMGFEVWSNFVVQTTNLYAGTDALTVATSINNKFLSSRDSLIDQNKASGAWNVDGWSEL